MEKIRHIIGITVIWVLILAVWGQVKTDGYTDVTSEEGYLDTMLVAEMPEQFIEEECKLLLDTLPTMRYIMRVTPLQEYEQLFCIGQQKVRIQEVYCGNEIQVGQEIYLTSNHWTLVLYDDEKSVGRGFVNFLKNGREYLVFCTEIVKDTDTDLYVMKLYDESYIAPVFCYETLENQIVETSEENTYVSYKCVKDNEFFSCSAEGFRLWNRLKIELLDMFPTM